MAFVAPRTPMEETLATLWTEVLDVPAPGIHDNFFQLGGTSLSSVLMLARVQETLGTDIPLERFFEAPFIAALATVLESSSEVSVYKPLEIPGSPLVLLSPNGTQTPLFCIHPVGGDVLCYSELARRLGEEQAFYGVRAQGLDGAQEPGQSIPAMARSYVDHIRQLQPSGPYRFMGWSMGGAIAFEMARQLEAQGEHVEFLALIDAYAHPTGEVPPGTDLGARVKQYLAQELHQDAEHLDQPRLVALRKVLEHHLLAIAAHTPEPYGGEVLLLQAEDVSNRALQANDNGWRPVATGGLQVLSVPGTHHTLLRPPNVDRLAGLLRAALRAIPREGDPSSRGKQAS
ncbi:hypothetical protein D7V97_42705 [Corallococcus sp. CA053C]|nr:hypothetical protein D7V97_42705 [Corallococcus sp. CA053C]